MSELKMIVWDVQHGNAVYVKTPNNKHLVFDLGSGDYSGHDAAFSPLNTLWDKYNVKKIDLLTITHPHLDHIDDILNLDRIAPAVLSRASNISRNDIAASIRDQDKPKFEKYFNYHERYDGSIAGTVLDPAIPMNYGGIKFQVFQTDQLPKSNLNNHSVVTVLEYLGGKIVIPGDNECASLELLMGMADFRDAVKNCDILIAPHHGRESACHDAFLLHANPLISVISDGSYCDTSANPKYSAKSRGWNVRTRSTNTVEKRKLLTTNSDGEVYVTIGASSNTQYSRTLSVEIP